MQDWRQVFRFDEKRLTWVITKVKVDLEERRERLKMAEGEKQKILYEQIERASSRIVTGLHKPLSLIHADTKATSEAMASFTESIAGIVKNMADAGKEMANGATKVSSAATGLNKAVSNFSAEFKGVLEGVRTGLSDAIQDMSEKSAKTMEAGSQKLEDATQEISAALASLSDDIKQTLGEVQGSIKESLAIQNRAFAVFDTTSQTLNEQIQKSTETANMMKDSIERGLEGVANASRNAGQAAKKMGEVAEKIDSIAARLESQNRSFGDRLLGKKSIRESRRDETPE